MQYAHQDSVLHAFKTPNSPIDASNGLAGLVVFMSRYMAFCALIG